MEESWTILELAELAAEALAATEPTRTPAGTGWSADAGSPSGPARVNGRVRDVPNERLIRWYVTVGLVDPPLSRRGRVARYGRRHLLQLVAVKRRQAEGRSLAEIQAELAGATEETLAAVACVPDARPAAESVAPEAPNRFWARPPGQRVLAAAEQPGEQDLAAARPPDQRVPAAAERPGEQDSAAAERPGEQDPAVTEQPGEQDRAAAERARRPAAAATHGNLADRGRSRLVQGIRLEPGVTLLLEGADREPGPDDLTAIVNAARPLLAELASRGLRADHLEWG